MKLRKDLIAVKNGNTFKYIDSKDILVGDKTLADVVAEHEEIKRLFQELINNVQDSYIVKKDTAYIIKINNKLQRIDKVELYEDVDNKPLKLCKVEDGQIKLDKEKVAKL
jgi:hypothetical protein